MASGEESPKTAVGGLSVLSVDKGDFKITFDKNVPGERERAAKTVEDLLKRGYAIMVDLPNGKTRRVRKFNSKTCEYIIKDVPPAELPAQAPKELAIRAETVEATAIARPARGCAREAW